MLRLRSRFWRQSLVQFPQRLIFIDETGVNLAVARRFGWAPAGERAIGHVPRNWGDSLTLVAGLSQAGIVAPLLLRGSMNTPAFLAYVGQFLVPELQRWHVVVMANLSPHRAPRVREMIEATGAELAYLPPYSPDFSPLEPAWSKVKKVLEDCAARTWRTMTKAVATALRSVTSADALSWFRYCGYPAVGAKARQ